MDGYTKSRSWLKYGHTEAAVLVLCKAWRRFMDLFGLQECPIKDLLALGDEILKAPVVAKEGSASAASSSGAPGFVW